MEADLEQSLEKIRSTLPELRKDGQPRRYMLQKREEGLAECLEILLRHVAIRDGTQQVSRSICRGCSHDRSQPCPVHGITEILLRMGRDGIL